MRERTAARSLFLTASTSRRSSAGAAKPQRQEMATKRHKKHKTVSPIRFVPFCGIERPFTRRGDPACQCCRRSSRRECPTCPATLAADSKSAALLDSEYDGHL